VRAGGAENRAQRPLSGRHRADAADDHATARLLHAGLRAREEHIAAARPPDAARRPDGQADHDQLFV